MKKMIIYKCIRCWEKHIYNIKKEWLIDWITINLACPNIQRYVKLKGFHFSWEANILKSDENYINNNLITRFWNLDLNIKKEKIKNIWAYILVIDEYTEYLNEIYNSYIMWYTYPFVISVCTLLERILNVMILKLKWYHIQTEDYKKIFDYIEKQNIEYNNDFDSISNWDIMINALYNWWYLNNKQKRLFHKFKNYRHNVVHFNQNYDFKSKEDGILLNFTELINSLFWIFERNDIVNFSSPWEFWIKWDMMNNPFVKEFFIPNGHLNSYNWSFINENYSEDWVKPWLLNEEEFFKLRNENIWFSQNKEIKFIPINIYGFNLFYRII